MTTHTETIREMKDRMKEFTGYSKNYCQWEIKGYIIAVKSELEFLKELNLFYNIHSDAETKWLAMKKVEERISDCESAIKLGKEK